MSECVGVRVSVRVCGCESECQRVCGCESECQRVCGCESVRECVGVRVSESVWV